jgi:hypothetical protein
VGISIKNHGAEAGTRVTEFNELVSYTKRRKVRLRADCPSGSLLQDEIHSISLKKYVHSQPKVMFAISKTLADPVMQPLFAQSAFFQKFETWESNREGRKRRTEKSENAWR